jgi:glycosyltransferase involved in cell wall biosynthesis
MRVLAWSALGYSGPFVTGVGKHIVHMIGGLARRAGWDVRLLMSADGCRAPAAQSASPLGHIPCLQLPVNRRIAEALWRTVGWPAIGADEADWLYCPRELYVPVRGARYAITVHDVYHAEQANGRFDPNVRRQRTVMRAIDEATLVLAVSEFTKTRLIELFGTPPAKIRVVGNGVEEEFFSTGDDDASAPLEGRRYVLSVGGLTHKKGAANQFAFAEALARKKSGLQLVVVGPVDPPFEAALGRAGNVTVISRGLSALEMSKIVRGARVALCLSDYEGFGIPVLEAMAAGVPVVAAKRAALPEVVGGAGVLADPARSQEIADIVSELDSDHDLRGELITKGRLRASQFTWSACVDRLATALEEFSAAAGARPAPVEPGNAV